MHEQDKEPGRAIPRREALLALGGLGAAALWLPTRVSAALVPALYGSVASAAATCVLTPEVTAGPYYISNRLYRRNIAAGQAGLPLTLRLTVQRASDCRPISRANVELWHANALGVYSGYGANSRPGSGGAGHAAPNNALTFLRGHQYSDASGLVVFDTIYPGWYRGRAPHIHLKVHVGGAVVHTGQLFFADSVSDSVYRTAHYRTHGQPDTTDRQDSIYPQAGGSRARLKLTKNAAAGGYTGALALGVRG